jgi:hypothetical protein
MKRARLHYLWKAPRAGQVLPRGDSEPAPLPSPEDGVQAPGTTTSWEKVDVFHSARDGWEER